MAAGLGKRMRSDLPKTLHEIAGKPLLFHIIDQVIQAEKSKHKPSISIVLGHGRERIESAVLAHPPYAELHRSGLLSFAVQKDQKGTGDAVRSSMDTSFGENSIKTKSPILVLPGDCPLIPSALIEAMSLPLGKGTHLRLLTTELENPKGYGRILRKGKKGPVFRIVEEKDANAREKEIKEVNTSIYLFEPKFLKASLARLSNKNAQGEYYLTDLVAMAAKTANVKAGKSASGKSASAKSAIDTLIWSQSEDLRGINDQLELTQAREIMNRRIVEGHARSGVQFTDLSSVWIDSSVLIEEGVAIAPGVILHGATSIGRHVAIGPHCQLKNAKIQSSVILKQGCVIDSSEVQEEAVLGPYAHLRPESIVGKKAKIGNFVELKKAIIGEKTAISHLSYLGDAEVGKNVNIGCGFITCNFDGRVINGSRKHKTVIEDDAFIGSDCQTVAPVKVGRGSFVASGSTITDDVPGDALAISRTRQITKLEYAKKLRS